MLLNEKASGERIVVGQAKFVDAGHMCGGGNAHDDAVEFADFGFFDDFALESGSEGTQVDEFSAGLDQAFFAKQSQLGGGAGSAWGGKNLT